MCWAPAKVLAFGEVIDKQGGPYPADLRAILKAIARHLSTPSEG